MRPSGGKHTCAELGATCGAKVRCHPARSRLSAAGGVAKSCQIQSALLFFATSIYALCHCCYAQGLLCCSISYETRCYCRPCLAVLYCIVEAIHHLWTLCHFKPYLIVFLQQDTKRTRSPTQCPTQNPSNENP